MFQTILFQASLIFVGKTLAAGHHYVLHLDRLLLSLQDYFTVINTLAYFTTTSVKLE
jgi:hypothetical protein